MNLEEREQTQNEQKEADRIRLAELEALSRKQQEDLAFLNNELSNTEFTAVKYLQRAEQAQYELDMLEQKNTRLKRILIIVCGVAGVLLTLTLPEFIGVLFLQS